MDKLTEAEWLNRKDQRIKQQLKYHDDFPLFTTLEFNLIAACTRRCAFCPVSDPGYYKKMYRGLDQPYLPVKLYEKIMQELAALDYRGNIAYSGFSEPLLYPHLNRILKLSRQYAKKARTVIISNGDRITEKNLEELFRCGLDELVISLYDGPQQYERLKKIIANSSSPADRIFFRRRYYNGTDYGFSLSSRCGLVDCSSFNPAENRLPLKRQCYYPFVFIKVDLNGDIIFCPHNWIKERVAGDASRENIFKVWRNSRMEELRLRLADGDRGFLPCRVCDVDGTKSGEESFKAWQQLKKPTQNT